MITYDDNFDPTKYDLVKEDVAIPKFPKRKNSKIEQFTKKQLTELTFKFR